MTPVDTVTTMLGSGLRFGEPRQSGPLTLVPIFHDGAAVPYRLFAGALADGVVTVGELGGGSVEELLVANGGTEPLLLLEGEVLGGLRQTRALNATVLVPAGVSLVVPVSCVERLRWESPRPVEREEFHASPGVRSIKNLGVGEGMRRGTGYRSDRREVWGSVDLHLEAHRVSSPTASYAEVQHRRRGDIAGVAAGFRPAAGQRGVLALAGVRPLALDVFDRPDTLGFLWRGLVGSYAADALVAAGGRAGGAGAVASAARVVALVAALARGDASVHASVGVGEAVFLTAPGSVVSALVVGSCLVHLAALWTADAPIEVPLPGESPEGPRAEPPRSWFGEAR